MKVYFEIILYHNNLNHQDFVYKQNIHLKILVSRNIKLNYFMARLIRNLLSYKLPVWPQWLLYRYLHLFYSFFWLTLIIISQQYVLHKVHATYRVIYTKNVVGFLSFVHVCRCVLYCTVKTNLMSIGIYGFI